MTDKTRRLFGLAAAFFVLCLAFAATKITLEEAVAETKAGPTICYVCSLATEENPIELCHAFEDLAIGTTECRLRAGKCKQEGEWCY
ncbi:MAG: hypothetical protein OXD43_11875 [Bacteroidetes bacterium]|nr:hypothetical protein [Bacteroidota bacterium]